MFPSNKTSGSQLEEEDWEKSCCGQRRHPSPAWHIVSKKEKIDGCKRRVRKEEKRIKSKGEVAEGTEEAEGSDLELL